MDGWIFILFSMWSLFRCKAGVKPSFFGDASIAEHYEYKYLLSILANHGGLVIRVFQILLVPLVTKDVSFLLFLTSIS